MFTMTHGEEKATTKMRRTIATIERAIDGAEIDWCETSDEEDPLDGRL